MVKLISRDYNTGYSIFAVDTVAELDKLPTTSTKGKDELYTISNCCTGSRAVVTETSDRYILNGNQNKWLKVSKSSGGGGGDLPSDWEFVDTSDIDNLF